MIGKSAIVALVAGSYALLAGVLVLIVVAVTTAFADGWKQRAQAAAIVDRAPQFSADGSLVAFLRTDDGPAQLWVVDDDGNEARPLGRASRFAWGRGHVLLFAHAGRVYRIGADGGDARRTREPLGPPRTTSRRRTVFARDHHVYVRDASGALVALT